MVLREKKTKFFARESQLFLSPHLSCGGKNGLCDEGACLSLDAPAAGVIVAFAAVVVAFAAVTGAAPPPDEKGRGRTCSVAFLLRSPPPPAPNFKASRGSGRLVRGFFFGGGCWPSAASSVEEKKVLERGRGRGRG